MDTIVGRGRRVALLATLVIVAAACGGGRPTDVGSGSPSADGTGGATRDPRLTFIDTYPVISISADGSTAIIVDSLQGTQPVYMYDVGNGTQEQRTETGSPERHVNGMADDGTAVIGSRDEPEIPAVWTEATDWVVLPSPSQGGCDGRLGSGWDLDEDGTVAVGLVWRDDCDALAARWRAEGDAFVLEPLEELGEVNRATVTSADGNVAGGFTHSKQGNRTPTIWGPDGRGVLLAPDRLDVSGEVLAMSADGTMAVGFLGENGFSWTEDAGLVDIGALDDPNGQPLTLANAIAADGRLIFGGSGHRVFSTQHAFVWTADAGMRKLGDIATANGLQMRDGYILSHVMGASSDGSVVVGFASNPDTHNWISFVLELPVSAYGI